MDVGYLYDDFTSASDFDLVVNYAKELGVLIWELKSMRKFFITVEGHTLVRSVYILPYSNRELSYFFTNLYLRSSHFGN